MPPASKTFPESKQLLIKGGAAKRPPEARFKVSEKLTKKVAWGTPQVVQWLMLYAPYARDLGSTPGQGTRSFPGVTGVKNLPAHAEHIRDAGLTPESGRATGAGMTTHSSIFAWKTPGTEEPARVRQDWSDSACMRPCTHPLLISMPSLELLLFSASHKSLSLRFDSTPVQRGPASGISTWRTSKICQIQKLKKRTAKRKASCYNWP